MHLKGIGAVALQAQLAYLQPSQFEDGMVLGSSIQQAALVHFRMQFADMPGRLVERRRFPRVALEMAAAINIDEQSFAARCLNLSMGGALMIMEGHCFLPATFILHLRIGSLGGQAVPVVGRRVEVRGRKVRLAFDPLPELVAVGLRSDLALLAPAPAAFN